MSGEPLAPARPITGAKQLAEAIQAAADASPDDPDRAAFEFYFFDSRSQRGVKRADKALLRKSDGTYLEPSTQRHYWTWLTALKFARGTS